MKNTLMFLFLSVAPTTVAAEEIEGSEESAPIDMKKLSMKRDMGKFIFYLEGEPYTGKAIKFHDNGIKAYEGSFKDGKDHGVAQRWYKSGEKRSETNFKDGKLHGVVTTWYESGQKEWEGNYKDGIQHGAETRWYESGQKSREEIYEQGQKVAEKEWATDGQQTKDETF